MTGVHRAHTSLFGKHHAVLSIMEPSKGSTKAHFKPLQCLLRAWVHPRSQASSDWVVEGEMKIWVKPRTVLGVVLKHAGQCVDS